jgi:hypothetical protein
MSSRRKAVLVDKIDMDTHQDKVQAVALARIEMAALRTGLGSKAKPNKIVIGATGGTRL